jgi:hypothetical protein
MRVNFQMLDVTMIIAKQDLHVFRKQAFVEIFWIFKKIITLLIQLSDVVDYSKHQKF